MKKKSCAQSSQNGKTVQWIWVVAWLFTSKAKMKSLTRQALLEISRQLAKSACDIPKLHFPDFKALCVDVVHIGIAIHTCLLYVLHSKIKANYCGRSQSSPIFMLCMLLFTYLLALLDRTKSIFGIRFGIFRENRTEYLHRYNQR